MELNTLVPFQSWKVTQREPEIVLLEKMSIYCVCRQPNDGHKMLQCTNSKEWFHVNCVSAPKEAIEEVNILNLVCN